MSHDSILLNMWVNNFGLLSLSIRQELDEMRITDCLPNRCWIGYRLGISLLLVESFRIVTSVGHREGAYLAKCKKHLRSVQSVLSFFKIIFILTLLSY